MRKKLVALVVMMTLVAALTPVAPATATLLPIPQVLSGLGASQARVDKEVPGLPSSGKRAVWVRGAGATTHIWTRAAGQLVATQVDNAPPGRNPCNPAVSNNFVVWQQKNAAGIWQIFMRHLPGGPVVQLTNNTFDSTLPEVDSGVFPLVGGRPYHRIVWMSEPNGNTEIFSAFMQAPGWFPFITRITNDTLTDVRPQVSCGLHRDRIVWQGYDASNTCWNVYEVDTPSTPPNTWSSGMTNLSGAAKSARSVSSQVLTTNGYAVDLDIVDNLYPMVDEDEMVWQANTSPYSTVWKARFNGSTVQNCRQLSSTASTGNATRPHLDGGKYVWVEDQGAGTERHLMATDWPTYNYVPQDVSAMFGLVGPGRDASWPRIDRRNVVWTETNPLAPTCSEVWLWRWSAAGAPVTTAMPNKVTPKPVVSGTLIVWTQSTVGAAGPFRAWWADPSQPEAISVKATVPGEKLPYLSFSVEASTAPDGGEITPTGIDFGTLAAQTPKTGMHRLFASTNTTEGYTVTAAEQGPLASADGTITDVAGDAGDITPTHEGSWDSSMTPGFGYTLSGADAAFTSGYRQFSDVSTSTGAAVGIMSNTGPVDLSWVDVGYKVNIGVGQEPGEYVTTVEYVATGNY